MARGGPRPGAGRPLGSKAKLTRELERRISATGENDLMIALSLVAEDGSVPMEVRLGAVRHLGWAMQGKVLLTLHSN
ncbi:MAG: hypothetical protein RPU35_04070 [Candidatus Sedimenticola sp. (ex Thyasira tokunagai)]